MRYVTIIHSRLNRISCAAGWQFSSLVFCLVEMNFYCTISRHNISYSVWQYSMINVQRREWKSFASVGQAIGEEERKDSEARANMKRKRERVREKERVSGGGNGSGIRWEGRENEGGFVMDEWKPSGTCSTRHLYTTSYRPDPIISLYIHARNITLKTCPSMCKLMWWLVVVKSMALPLFIYQVTLTKAVHIIMITRPHFYMFMISQWYIDVLFFHIKYLRDRIRIKFSWALIAFKRV